MVKLSYLLFFILLSFSAVAQTPADADLQNRRKAAEQLMATMDMEMLFNEAIKASMDLQVQQNPQLGQYRSVMEEFFSKYFTYATIKEPLTTVYAESFTEKELKDLIAFYQTPTGQKAAKKQPELMQKGMQLGQQEVKNHLPELQAMMMKHMQEKGKQ